MKFAATMLAGLLTIASLSGCGSDGPARKQTFSVKGVLTVDGQPPMSPMQLQCHGVGGIDTNMPSLSQAISDPDGTFEISTYEKGDGVPPGEYTLTIEWRQFSSITMSYGGKDRLGEKYADPKTSTVKFTVKDQPVDLGEIALKTE